MRWQDMHLEAGDVIRNLSEGAVNGLEVTIPKVDGANYMAGNNAIIVAKNIGGVIDVYTRGECFGDDNRWQRVLPCRHE